MTSIVILAAMLTSAFDRRAAGSDCALSAFTLRQRAAGGITLRIGPAMSNAVEDEMGRREEHSMRLQRPLVVGSAAIVIAAVVVAAVVGPLGARANGGTAQGAQSRIQHLVVIFQENVSFDHYFGTYPNAANPAGEPRFTAKSDTPTVNGLNEALLTHNPNFANPQRLDRSQALTCDQDHSYLDEQKAVDHGLMDQFIQTAGGSCTDKSIVMDYYDGNTVTALWNYAQHFAMSDNSFSTNYGPSTVGALNLISGQTHGATTPDIAGTVANGTVIGDPRPIAALDDCTIASAAKAAMSGTNVGDLLNAKGVTWGWFQGGFAPSSISNGKAVCGSTHQNIGGATITDYIPHHEPFQYFTSTANPHHLPPTSIAMIGKSDQANHQYDLSDFWAAFAAGNMPAVSYLKAAAYQDGHAGYSDPLDEQTFLVNTINKLEQSPYWSSTAVVIAYDDSDGWYDHVLAPVVSQSNSVYDALSGPGACGTAPAGAYQDRCGYGVRQPLLIISPFAKHNFVDHSVTDQSSILRFIEDNWNLGRIGNQSFDALAGSLDGMLTKGDEDGGSKLFLDPSTGKPA
jgi:phospholipase C